MQAAFRHIAQALAVLCGLFLSVGLGQITVVSEFQRMDPFGQTVREDLQDSQREILSPAVARNAFASFRVVVDIPAGKPYYLHVGLNPEDCEKVFEKFYRVSKDKSMAPGTGLGLPLAKHIVEDVHGGRLTLKSELGRGSIFRITLSAAGRMHE